MIRHFNHTDRRRIEHEDITVELFRSPDGGPAEFAVTKLELAAYDFEPDAVIRIEAHKGNALQRWSWGAIANPQPPPQGECLLTDVPSSSKFRVAVVAGDGSGRLLGLGDRITPTGGRESLIHVVPTLELGEDVWRVDFSNPDPELHVNASIADITDRVRRDPAFRSLVLPEVLRTVLHRAVMVEGADPNTDEEDQWTDWFRLAKRHHSASIPKLAERRSEQDFRAAWGWIDDVVSAFAAQPALKAAHLYAGAGGD